MATNFRFVTDSTERQADEFAPERARDRAAERSLAGSRGSDEAQNRSLAVLLELAYRKELENALLDLVQIIVVLIEDLARVGDIEIVLGRNTPGHSDQPVEVGANHRVLRGFGRNHLQAIEFLVSRLARLGRHLGLFDLLLEFLDFRRTRVAFTQFLLDRLELLAQVVLALVFVQLGLYLGLDLVPKFQQFDFSPEDRDQLFESRAHVERRDQILRLLDGDLEVRRDHVCEPTRVGHLHRPRLQFVWQVGYQGHKLGELAHQVRLERIDLFGGRYQLRQPGRVGDEIGSSLSEIAQLDSRQSLHQNPHALVGVAQHLENLDRAAARVEPLGRGVFLFRVFLCGQPDNFLRRADILDEFERGRPRDQERMNLVGKNYDAA